MTTLVLVRHAQTTDNVANIWSGTNRDPQFSPEGQDKVVEITQLLQEQYPHPSAILSAPFYRSLETIRPFAQEQGITPIFELDQLSLDPSCLNESNHGSLTGLTPEQREGLDLEGFTPVQCKAIDSWKKHQSLSPENAYYSPVTEEEGVVSKDLYSEQLVATLKKICALYPGQTVILSLGGGGPIHALRARAWMKKGAIAEYTKNDIQNAYLYVIQGTPDTLFVEGEEL